MVKKQVIKKIDCWKTRVWICNSHPLERMRIEGDVILDFNKFESIKPWTSLLKSIIIEADPFLFVKDGILYLFYESKKVGEKGMIKVVSTSDLQDWTEPVTVLDEKCHLSYPFVFEDGGDVYMIPETGSLKSIRLYKAINNDFTTWEFVRTLVKYDEEISDAELSFCDSSILKYNGIYYLFTTIGRKNINELHIYYSDSLELPFVRHPQNPIIRSNKFGRCAGSIISYEDKLYRVTQECTKSYGENVCVTEITGLTPIKYKEKVLTEAFFGREDDFYINGAHQLNVVRFKDKFVVATDAKGYRDLWIQRLLSKISKHI